MKTITVDIVNEVTESPSAILLIYANGCTHCETAKPLFESLESKYPEFTFYKMEFSEQILPFYKTYVKEGEDGQTNIAFPTFFFFLNKNVTSDNELGFIGEIGGLAMDKVEFLLHHLTAKELMHG